MPCVPTCLTCLRVSNYCVPMYLHALNYYVSMCLRALIFQVPTCLRAYVPIYIFRAYMSSCLKLFRAYVRSFFMCLRVDKHSQNILRVAAIPRIAVFLWIIWPFIPLKTPKQTLTSKIAYPICYWVLLSQLVYAQRQSLWTH